MTSCYVMIGLLLMKDLTDGPRSPTVQPRGGGGVNPGDEDEKTAETRCTLADWIQGTSTSMGAGDTSSSYW